MNKLKTYEEEVSVSFAKMFHDYHSLSPQLLSTAPHPGKQAHVQSVHQPVLAYTGFVSYQEYLMQVITQLFVTAQILPLSQGCLHTIASG